ncbi:MAG: BREX-3 system phosphatase PglZ [Deltaproteobacteria bacterium]|nr:BREX-3 system phosphatase PglZ [Deltaproteobacteria bacterium]
MSSWRDQILKEFTPKVAKLTLVADPDGLLLEERILEGIRERGFELIPFEDHVAFRYAYESKFRSRWDRGEQTDLVVVLRSQASDLASLPYDLLQAGRKLSFNLGDIFPNLSYPVITALDRGDLDALYEAQKRYAPDVLGDNSTKEFALRHVFEIAPEFIHQPFDLLRVLLRRHYRGQRLPSFLDERLIQLLRQNNTFDDWPLETLVSDREAFFAFLQERWPVFLDHLAAKGAPSVHEEQKPYVLTIDGPQYLPFDDHDIRVYMDNLFLEGFLQPVPHEHADALSKVWVSIGVRTDPAGDRSRRLTKLIENLQSSIPAEDARHREWLHFARGWAELTLLAHDQEIATPAKDTLNIKSLQTQVDAVFVTWLTRRYAGLINLPPVPPVMLHHLPRVLARHVGEDRNCKVALLLVDGLSLDQWIVVREALALRSPHLRFRENAVFAWIPTITSVSRQATFAGKPPIFFPNSIQTTDKEPALWTQFWADQGLLQNEVIYAKGLGDGSLESIEELLSHPQARVAGLVIDKVDKIMHGMELGAAGMHNQVRQWVQQSYIIELLDLLLERGFCVFLTSDHGNIEAEGCGRPAEGVVADLRGERVRLYSDARLRHSVKERFPSAIEWQPVGLPEDYLALIAPNRLAFVRSGERIVSHGGFSIEELIVPLIQIERRDT